MMMKTALVALAALACAAPASASTAENPFAQDKAVLNLRGLDLSTAEGQQRLAIRLDHAARAVCGERLAGVHLALEAKSAECRSAVVADVRTQVEARLAKTGKVPAVQFAAAY
jgi:UrcA family protein